MKSYLFYGTLESVLADLPAGMFILCHRSCIVNVGNITEKARIDLTEGKDRMMMPNGEACMVSSRKRSRLLKLVNTVSKLS